MFCWLAVGGTKAAGQTIASMRADQISRLQNYVLDAIEPSGMVRGALVTNPAGSHFHPATPDSAGFALIALASLDHLGTLADADQRVIDILSAYTGNTPGVTPARSVGGHYYHWLQPTDGTQHPWNGAYSPIGSALIVAGAQFARNHFAGTSSLLAAQIDALTEELTDSIDFDAAIHSNLAGGVHLNVGAGGGGVGGVTMPWNEYQLVVSLALRQENNDRAVAVKHRWLNPDNAPKRSIGAYETITGPISYAPAFFVQQANFFNGDFRHDPEFQFYHEQQRLADELYSSTVLGQSYRYGITAGLSPSGYHADKPYDHPDDVFSPEAVGAWGDLDTLLEFYLDQPPASNPRYRYGMLRVSEDQPGWIPSDTGLVDHLFLLYGLVESLHPDFYADRVFAPLLKGDYDYDGDVDAADYTVWRDSYGSTTDLRADGDMNGVVNTLDYDLWLANFGAGVSASSGAGSAASTPEPSAAVLLVLALASWSRRPRTLGAIPLRSVAPCLLGPGSQPPLAAVFLILRRRELILRALLP